MSGTGTGTGILQEAVAVFVKLKFGHLQGSAHIDASEPAFVLGLLLLGITFSICCLMCTI